jgi:hypothetical protein
VEKSAVLSEQDRLALGQALTRFVDERFPPEATHG